MPSVCDHTSVGIIVKNKKGHVLLIERAQFPPGWAPPAGHIDKKYGSAAEAAQRELEEEVGLYVRQSDLKEIHYRIHYNKCRREDGWFHWWWVFEAKKWAGRVRVKKDEARAHLWAGPRKMQELIAAHQLDPVWGKEIFPKLLRPKLVLGKK